MTNELKTKAKETLKAVNKAADRGAKRGANILKRAMISEAPISSLRVARGRRRDRNSTRRRRRPGTLKNGHRVTRQKEMNYKVENNVPYALFAHNGTKYQRGNPWMTRAMQSAGPQAKAEIANAVKNVL